MRVTPITPPRWGGSLALALRLIGWLALNLLGASGMLAILVLAIGNFRFEGLMLQLANLATRYVAASAARQEQFNLVVAVAFGVAFLILCLLRCSSVLAMIEPRGKNASKGGRV
jgi:hypothetical protein